MIAQHNSLRYARAGADIVTSWINGAISGPVSIKHLFPYSDEEELADRATTATASLVCEAAVERRLQPVPLIRAVYEFRELCEGLGDELGVTEIDSRLCGSVGAHNPARGRHVG